LIDTRIWGLAFKRVLYRSDHPSLLLAEKADEFLRKALLDSIVLLSGQLVAEIYHVLTARGTKMPRGKASKLIDDLLTSENTEFRTTDLRIVKQALKLSTQTGFHIWDFLLVLPFKGEVDKIYTMDPHFRDCKELQIAPIKNPLGVWKVEGKKE